MPAKDLHNLIRIRKWDVDEKQRALRAMGIEAKRRADRNSYERNGQTNRRRNDARQRKLPEALLLRDESRDAPRHS